MAAVGSLGVANAPAVASAAAPLRPVFARTVVLAPAGGTVRVKVPGAYAGFVRLSAPRTVPVGALVDTTAGTVRLTSADPSGQTQSGQFFRGIFRIEQSRAAAGLVDLRLRDNLARSVCAAGAASARAQAAAVNRRVLGLLRGRAKGRFRTRGRFAAATVRGTDWGVRDRCDGTLTVVRQGVVAVTDFRLHKTVVVRAGQTYLAKAP